MLSSRCTHWANRYSGSRPATTGSILVDRKKNITSVHLRTGLIDSAYAAGMDRTSTRIVEMMLAVAELISGGQGLAPLLAPKKFAQLSSVSGAKNDGGLVAAVVSLCSEVSSIHNTGNTKMIPMTQAATPSSSAPRLGLGALVGISFVAVGFAPDVSSAVIGPPPGTATTRRAGRTWRWRSCR